MRQFVESAETLPSQFVLFVEKMVSVEAKKNQKKSVWKPYGIKALRILVRFGLFYGRASDCAGAQP